MSNSLKLRRQRRHKVPEDFSSQGRAIVKPYHAAEREVRKYFTLFSLITKLWFNRDVRARITPALSNKQSLRKKGERIWAAAFERVAADFHTPETMNKIGMRMVDCQCGPNVGHNAEPSRRKPLN